MVGGDSFTLKKLVEVTRDGQGDSPPGRVVIVKGSGGISEKLADIYNELEETVPRQAKS